MQTQRGKSDFPLFTKKTYSLRFKVVSAQTFENQLFLERTGPFDSSIFTITIFSCGG